MNNVNNEYLNSCITAPSGNTTTSINPNGVPLPNVSSRVSSWVFTGHTTSKITIVDNYPDEGIIDEIRRKILESILESKVGEINEDLALITNVLRSKLKYILDDPSNLLVDSDLVKKFQHSNNQIESIKVNIAVLQDQVYHLESKVSYLEPNLHTSIERIDDLTSRLENLEFLIHDKLLTI